METKAFDYLYHTFDSGLRLVAVPMPATRTVTVLTLVGTGSKYETKDINGISHFLEHMMFKGTQKRPGTLDISRELDSIGANYNAFTGKEYTGYYAKASSDKLDVVLDVISDIFLNSKMDEKEIEVEKGVVIEELNMDRDMPARYVMDLFEELLYGDQPAGWDIGGEKEIIQALKRDQFVTYFNTHYIAKNTIVAIAGDINSEEVKNKVAEYFKTTRLGEPATKIPVQEVQTEPKLLLHFKETDQAHFCLGLRAYNMYDDRKYALSVLAGILGGGMSSRLFSEVREKRGLAYYVSAGNNCYTDSGFFLIRAGVNKARALEALQVIMDELRKVLRDGITGKELQQAKDEVTGEMVLELELSDNVAGAYADSVLYENKVLTPEEKLVKIMKLTVDEVNAVTRDIFKNQGLNLALIGPFKDEEPFKKILNI